MMNKKLIFLFVFFLGFLSFPGAGFARESLIANHYVQEGKKLFEKKDYDLAIVEFNKALLADPQHEEALMYLRMLGFGGGDKRDIVKTREQKQDLPALDKNTEPQKNVSKSTPQKAVEPPKDLTTPAVENQVIEEQKPSAQALQAQSPQKAKKSCRVKKEASKKKVKKAKVKKFPMPACELKAKNPPAKEVSKIEKPQIAKEAEKEAESVSPVAVEPQNTPQKSSKKPMSPVAQKPLEPLASGEKKTGLPKPSDEETPDEKARIHQEFSREKLDKMRKAHAKYSRKPIGKNQKAVFKDVNGDGVKERISLAEKKELEKIEAQIDKKEKAALKNLEKKSAQKEKAIFKNTSAPKASGRKAGFSEYKAGDVVSSSDAGQSEDLTEIKKDNLARDGNAKRKKSLPENPENVVKQDALKTQPIDLPVDGDDQAPAPQENMKTVVSKKDVQPSGDLAKPQVAVNQDELAPSGDLAKPQVVVNQDERPSDTDTSDVVKNNPDEVLVEQPNSAVKETAVDQGALLDKQDLAQKEKETYKKSQAKKAAAILEAQKVSLEKAAKPAETSNGVDKDSQSVFSSAKQQEFSTAAFSQAVEQKVKPVAKENTVLKKKLGEVIEIAQQDQKTIQELEENAKAQSDKVEVLENDLVETKQALETKKEELREQSVKLQDLQTRIAAMETEVHSKQYDFKDKQLEYEKKLQAIEQEFGNYKSQKAKNEEELQEQLKILKEALTRKIAELNEAQEKLIFVENKLAKSESEHAVTRKAYEELKKTMSDLESRLTDLPTEVASDQMPTVELDIQKFPSPKSENEFMYQEWIKRHDKLITKLKEKLLWAREQMDYLGRYDIKLSDQKMAALKEELAAVKRQLSLKDQTGQKSADYVLMEERLKDAQQRLEIVEKILREKDEQVQELEKQLNGVLSAF